MRISLKKCRLKFYSLCRRNCGKMKYLEHINQLIKTKVSEADNLVIFGQNVSAGSCLSGLTKNLKVKENSLIINTPNCENTLCGIGFGLMLNKVSSIFFMKQQDFLLLGIDPLVNTYNFIRRENPSASFTIVFIIVDQGYQGLQSSLNNIGDFCSIARVPGFTITNKTDAEEILGKHLISPGFRMIGISQRLFNEDIGSIPLVKFNKDRTIFQYFEGKDATIVCFNLSFSYGFELHQQLKNKNFNASLFSVNTATPISWEEIAQNVKQTKKIVIIDDSKSMNLSCDNLLAHILQECEVKTKIIIKREFSENWLWPNPDKLDIDPAEVIRQLKV